MQFSTHYGAITRRWRLGDLSIDILSVATVLMFAAAMMLDFDFNMSHADKNTSQTIKCMKESYSTIRPIEERGLNPNSTEWRRMRETVFRNCMDQAFVTGLKAAP